MCNKNGYTSIPGEKSISQLFSEDKNEQWRDGKSLERGKRMNRQKGNSSKCRSWYSRRQDVIFRTDNWLRQNKTWVHHKFENQRIKFSLLS